MNRWIAGFADTFRDGKFLKKASWIALPIAAQGLLNTVTNLIDTLMIGSLGESTIAAVGLANKVFFVFSLLIFGISSGSAVLAAQYWGNRDVRNLRKVQGLALMIGIAGSLLFVIPSLLCPEAVMMIFTNSEDAIAIGARYLRIAAISYPLTAVSNTYVCMLRAVNQVKVPVCTSLLAIATNIVLNYILIFGKLGLPALGVEGAATATLIARCVEACALLSFVYITKSPVAARLRDMLHEDRAFIGKFFRTVSPVIANEFMWGLGVTIYSLAYGRMGDQAMAAITITQTIEEMMTVFFQGTSNAAAVIIGNALGADDLPTAKDDARKFIYLQLAASAVVAVLLVAVRWPIISLFEVSDTVANYVSLCLIVFAVFTVPKMFNYVNVVGVLRSGGDTRYCLFLDCFGVWGIGIPLAFLGGLILHFPIYIVFGMVMLEEIFKMVLGIRRYKKGSWIKNLTI